jgi:hypothetical protein
MEHLVQVAAAGYVFNTAEVHDTIVHQGISGSVLNANILYGKTVH